MGLVKEKKEIFFKIILKKLTFVLITNLSNRVNSIQLFSLTGSLSKKAERTLCHARGSTNFTIISASTTNPWSLDFNVSFQFFKNLFYYLSKSKLSSNFSNFTLPP